MTETRMAADRKIIRLTLDIPVSVATNKAFVAAVNDDPDSVLFHALRRILAADAASLFDSALVRAIELKDARSTLPDSGCL